MDGCEACAYVAYALSENAFLYPITPSSPIGEKVDQMKAEGKENIWGKPLSVEVMQSEGGAAGAFHGSCATGNITTSFSSSQGLLLKVPNLYKIAGNLLPGVIHIVCRSLSKSADNIHPDHQDIMATKQSSWAMLSDDDRVKYPTLTTRLASSRDTSSRVGRARRAPNAGWRAVT